VLRLYRFAISHFSEKARWALDLNTVAYEERPLLPGPHVPIIRRIAPRTSVPTLQHDQTVVQGSSAILDYAEQRLGATRLCPPPSLTARSVELEALADRAFGLGTQRIFYSVLLEDRSTVVDLWTQDGPWWGRAFYALAFGVVERGVRRMYKIKPEPIEQAIDLFRRTFDETDEMLRGGSPYLFGDQLTRADVAVASLLAPLCRPPEHPLRWPPDNANLLGFVRQFEGRPTWQFVRRMYREHRKTPSDQRA
jgi:glutathione S-transferase